MSLYTLEILLLALIAGILGYRLWSVLGRRTGAEERRPNPFGPRPDEKGRPEGRDAEAGGRDNVVSMPGREAPEREAPALQNGERFATDAPGVAADVGAGLTQIQIADRNFDPRHFVEGARAAFKMIVEAYAAADTATLRPLLADDLYDEFSRAIRERLEARHSMEETVEAVDAADIIEAQMDGRTALVTVKFASRQRSVTRDAEGRVVEGDPDTAIEVVDIWTFARNTRSTDPNWLLVATRTPN